MELFPVQPKDGAKIQMHGIVQFHLHSLFPGELLFIGVRVQMPLVHEGEDVRRLDLHTEINHQSFGAGINRRNDPMPPGPIKLCVCGNFFAGPLALRVAPKAAVKSYFPWWRFLWRGRVHVLIVVILCIRNGRKIKRRLELLYIVKGIIAVMKHAPERRKDSDGLPVAPHRIYNIGKGTPEKLMDFLEILGEELVSARVLPSDFDLRSHLEMFPMQPGDVAVTFADTSALEQDFHYIPDTGLREGLRKFALWYRDYYRL